MENMNFKKWLIQEMGHKSIYDKDGKNIVQLSNPEGQFFDAIDFRLEDYPKTTIEERNFIIPLLRDQIKPLAFYGKFPNSSRYAYYNGNFLTYTLKKPEKGTELPQKDRFGHSWFDYAELLRDNTVIKDALHIRDDRESIIKDIDKSYSTNWHGNDYF
jgi:hypothetical protein